MRKSRRSRLQRKVGLELTNKIVNIEHILNYVDQYEKDNLDTINTLKREKIVTTKRINGALKQTITAHGPITKILIGSATKRIYGSLLGDVTKETKYKSSEIFRKLLEVMGAIYIIYTIWK